MSIAINVVGILVKLDNSITDQFKRYGQTKVFPKKMSIVGYCLYIELHHIVKVPAFKEFF